MDVDLTDGQQHDLELYFLDWDRLGRSEQVQITNAATGAVLSTQTVSSFQSGTYLDYTISGNVLITITKEGPANAVLSGLFLDGTSGDAVKAGALTTGAASSGVHRDRGRVHRRDHVLAERVEGRAASLPGLGWWMGDESGGRPGRRSDRRPDR